MNNQFDTIIWGASLEGIKKATELTRAGQQVLLCSKFGFPGGAVTEGLASLFTTGFFENDPFNAELLLKIEKLKYGVLFRNTQYILLHPEAVKRVCWQILEEQQLKMLFHVTPVKCEQDRIQLFGREGMVRLHAKEILDSSDNALLSLLNGKEQKKTMVINSFFTGSLPADFPGFQIIRRFETPIGQYISVSEKNVSAHYLEQTFNRELDRLSKESWKKHQARICMIPVYPEIRD